MWCCVTICGAQWYVICDHMWRYPPHRKVVFQPPFFRGYVKLQGCTCWLVMICADMFCKMESNESPSRCCEKFPTITSSYLFFGGMFLRVSWLLSKVPVRPLDLDIPQSSFWTTRHPLGFRWLFFEVWNCCFLHQSNVIFLPSREVFFQFAPENTPGPKRKQVTRLPTIHFVGTMFVSCQGGFSGHRPWRLKDLIFLQELDMNGKLGSMECVIRWL